LSTSADGGGGGGGGGGGAPAGSLTPLPQEIQAKTLFTQYMTQSWDAWIVGTRTAINKLKEGKSGEALTEVYKRTMENTSVDGGNKRWYITHEEGLRWFFERIYKKRNSNWKGGAVYGKAELRADGVTVDTLVR
jgi:hypothetical protein